MINQDKYSPIKDNYVGIESVGDKYRHIKGCEPDLFDLATESLDGYIETIVDRILYPIRKINRNE